MSARSYSGVFSEELLGLLLALPEVVEARSRLTTTPGKVQFSIPATETLRATLFSRLGLQLPADKDIPMRWIQGETASHVDRGASAFHDTYLVYLTQSPGSFLVDGAEHPIEANTGFRFSEGLRHETVNTGPVPRLLLGPMNEFAEPVGVSAIYYFDNYTDAYNRNTSSPGWIGFNASSVDYVIDHTVSGSPSNPTGSLAPYTNWRVAYVSFNNPYDISIPPGVYPNGFDLATFVAPGGGIGNTTFYLYPATPCFLEGSEILCVIEGKELYLPVEQLRQGTLVKTSSGATKLVAAIGKGSLQNPGSSERSENRLYKLTPAAYPQLKKDLYITGCHSILVNTLTEEEREATNKHLGAVFVTEGKYRLMACVDRKAEPWASEGAYPIWHFALEHEDVRMNYGVYANGGLLVETCSINFITNRSNMTLV